MPRRASGAKSRDAFEFAGGVGLVPVRLRLDRSMSNRTRTQEASRIKGARYRIDVELVASPNAHVTQRFTVNSTKPRGRRGLLQVDVWPGIPANPFARIARVPSR